jgi:hypothetical protein
VIFFSDKAAVHSPAAEADIHLAGVSAAVADILAAGRIAAAGHIGAAGHTEAVGRTEVAGHSLAEVGSLAEADNLADREVEHHTALEAEHRTDQEEE